MVELCDFPCKSPVMIEIHPNPAGSHSACQLLFIPWCSRYLRSALCSLIEWSHWARGETCPCLKWNSRLSPWTMISLNLLATVQPEQITIYDYNMTLIDSSITSKSTNHKAHRSGLKPGITCAMRPCANERLQQLAELGERWTWLHVGKYTWHSENMVASIHISINCMYWSWPCGFEWFEWQLSNSELLGN